MHSYTATLNTETTVITLTQAKEHLRITHDYEDDVIQSFIDASVIAAENYTGRYLHTYDVVLKTTEFGSSVVLQYAPLIDDDAVVITYYDLDNVEQTLASTYYDVLYRNGEPEIFYNPKLTLPSVYERNDAVKIAYQSGYTTVPEAFKQYCKLVVTFLYENRSDSVDKLPRFTHTLLRPYKKWH